MTQPKVLGYSSGEASDKWYVRRVCYTKRCICGFKSHLDRADNMEPCQRLHFQG